MAKPLPTALLMAKPLPTALHRLPRPRTFSYPHESPGTKSEHSNNAKNNEILGAQKTTTVATTDTGTFDDTPSIIIQLQAATRINIFSLKNFQLPGLHQPSSQHATQTVSASDLLALPDVTLGNANNHEKETTVG